MCALRAKRRLGKANMQAPKNEDRNTKLEALRRERARQDEALADAAERLRAEGHVTLAVPRAALEDIDAACLIHLSPLNHAAIRG
jgi:hypothetical protein